MESKLVIKIKVIGGYLYSILLLPIIREKLRCKAVHLNHKGGTLLLATEVIMLVPVGFLDGNPGRVTTMAKAAPRYL